MNRPQPRPDPVVGVGVGSAPPVPPRNVGATALRIGLGQRLRVLRERAGITREAAGHAIRGSAPKISRLELGRVKFKERDVVDLLRLYGVDDGAELTEFLELVRHANAPGWWHRYSELLPTWFETYVGLEQASAVIRSYECQFVPGLLQTAGYAREVIKLVHSDPREVEQRVELRMHRQQILDEPGGPMLWAVVDEAVLRRPLASPDLHRAQLDRLIERCAQPNVTLQIARFGSGGLPAAGGAFTILRFDAPDLPDIVYLEQLSSALYLDKRADVELYASVMDRLCALVGPPDDTARLLHDIRAGL